MAFSGAFHTITLSNDGVVHSFGQNDVGQLGLGVNDNKVLLPSHITNLPRIKQVACGFNFTFCVDFEGFLWSFGKNNEGQLGTGNTNNFNLSLVPQNSLGQLDTGNTTHFNVPQQIQNIPPVLSVACGSTHTLFISNDGNFNLWSCGKNDHGQLCLGHTEQQSIFQQTSFSNILKVSLGGYHSLFQNDKGEIYSCGYNFKGQLGLGHFETLKIIPTLIPNLPPNIVQFICGCFHCLFLDLEGNVFSVGHNYYGQLGLGHITMQNILNNIPNIPPIQTISSAFHSSYLIDFEGNVWSFGAGSLGQLGHGDKNNLKSPKKIESLKDIQQISKGPYGDHFLVKDSQNSIFAIGSNNCGQLGTGDTESVPIPKVINSKYFSIWGEDTKSRAKSARK